MSATARSSSRPASSADIVRALPAGAVEVELTGTDDETVSISAGRSQFSIRPLGLDDYPMQVEPAAEAVTLSSASVAEALRQVVRAASTDDARAVLTGVLIAAEDDGVRLVATDSYRLAVRDLPDNDDAGRRSEGAGAQPGAQRAAATARSATPS